jgi:hypothetical protein
VPVPSLMALPVRGRGTTKIEHQIDHEVTKLLCRGAVLERPAIVGNSPVLETLQPSSLYPK